MALQVVRELEIVAVLRRCRVCGAVKPLEHFLVYRGNHGETVKGDVKVCAACRGRGLGKESA